LGIQGVGDSQIIEGLTVNDWVVCDISPAKPLKEGMKVAMTPRVTRQVERPKGNDVPNGFK
jgi:hypothetical protein